MPDTTRFHAFVGTKPPRFANEAERECAQILDFHGIAWDYEPHTFALETAGDGSVTEAFTPDFYLPEQELYLEITTMKQSLVTKKNRKVRRLRELHPELRIKLFYKRDVEALAAKYELDDPSDGRPQRVA
jgi:hypoxanthine phosphoribosyltransferase